MISRFARDRDLGQPLIELHQETMIRVAQVGRIQIAHHLDIFSSNPPHHASVDGGIGDLPEAGTPCHIGVAMKNGNGNRKEDEFIASARRAFRRVGRQLRAENARLGLPLIVGDKKGVRLIRPR